jgi:hypothetical protein
MSVPVALDELAAAIERVATHPYRVTVPKG